MRQGLGESSFEGYLYTLWLHMAMWSYLCKKEEVENMCDLMCYHSFYTNNHKHRAGSAWYVLF